MALGSCARRSLLVASMVAALCSGCESGLDLHYHGRRRVAEGDYRVLSMFGDGRDDFVLANDRAREGELAVLPFEGAPCRVGSVARYFAVRSKDGLRIGLYDENDAPRALRFVDTHCKQSIPEIAGVIDTQVVDDGFLVSIDGGRLVLADPWGSSTRLITEDLTEIGSSADVPVRAGEPSLHAFWLLEGDRLVLRGEDGAELRGADGRALRPAIRGVTEIAVAGQGQSMIYSNQDGTYRLGHEGYAPQRIAIPGCKLRYETGIRGAQTFDLAMMLAPCRDGMGRLISIDFDGKSREFAYSVISYFRRIFVDDDGQPEPFTFYVTREAEDAPKRYFMASPDPDAPAIELDVPISSRSTLLPLGLRDGVARAWLITTAEDDVRGGFFTPELGFTAVASGVRAIAISRAGLLVLHDYTDEDGGTLSLVSERDAALRPIAERVPAQGLFDSGQFAIDRPEARLSSLREADVVLHDAEDGMGTLSEIEDDGRLIELGRDVPSWSPSSYVTVVRGRQLIEATRDLAVLSYLRDFDDTEHSGTLAVVDPNGESLVLGKHVTSHVSSGDSNRRGVLYATTGKSPEVWFVQQ
jgi:hypothetical protein